MRTLLLSLASLSLALLLGSRAAAQETLTPQRMAERIFLFHDMKADMVAQARIITMVAPMEQRLELRQRYTLALNGLDMKQLRERFGREMTAKLSPEEVALLYRNMLESRMLIAEKLAKVRADIAPLKAALSLHLLTGFDGLGEFAIEHPPKEVPEERIRSLLGIMAKAGEAQEGEAERNYQAEAASLEAMGMSKEEAEAFLAHWMQRLTMATLHSMAKHLTEAEARQLLEARNNPKLAKVLEAEDALLEDFRNRTTNELLAKMRKDRGR